MSGASEYSPTGIPFAYKKHQPSVYLFVCPVCGMKHEREGNVISFEKSLCDVHLNLYKRRRAALSALPPWDRPKNQEEYDDMYDHVKWLQKLEGYL